LVSVFDVMTGTLYILLMHPWRSPLSVWVCSHVHSTYVRRWHITVISREVTESLFGRLPCSKQTMHRKKEKRHNINETLL